MAINLDRNLLEEIGLGSLPEAEQRSLLNHIYETLEMRVGMRLADQMSNEQLDEFERYFEAKDENGAFHWLETNFPNYKDIVQDEFNKLKEEVRSSAPQILQASQANANAPQQPSMPAADPQVPPMMPTNPGFQQPQPQTNPDPGQYQNPNPQPAQPYQPPLQQQPQQTQQPFQSPQQPMPPYQQPPTQQPPDQQNPQPPF